jgi:hypothetical protein
MKKTRACFDSLVGCCAASQYALNKEDQPIPFDIIEENRVTHPFKVLQRAMLSVSYFEKALYEMPKRK